MIKMIAAFADWDIKRYSLAEMYWRLQDLSGWIWQVKEMAVAPKGATVKTAEEQLVSSHLEHAHNHIQDALQLLGYAPSKTEMVTRVAEQQGQTVQVSQLRRDPITEETYIVENKPEDKTHFTSNWKQEFKERIADLITVDIAPEVEQIFNDAFTAPVELDALGQPKYDADGDEILRYTSSPGIGKSEYLKPDGGLDPSDIAGYLKAKGTQDVIEKGYLVMRDALDDLTQRIQDIVVELDGLEPDPDPMTNSPHMLAMLKSIVSNQSPEYVLKMLATAYAEAAMDEPYDDGSGDIALAPNQQLYRAAFWAVEKSKAEYKRNLKEHYNED
jgi:hypothetical protein